MADHKAQRDDKGTPEELSDTARDEKVAELEILQQSFEEKKRLSEEYYNQLVRLKAEFENFRKRSEKEKRDHLIWGKEDVLLKQISLLDVLEQANRTVQTCDNIESIRTGVRLITQEFSKMLASEGVAEIGCVGEKFDPCLHEAIEQTESCQPDGTIVEVLKKGFMLNGRVIRPAGVRVAKHVDGIEEQKLLQ